MTTKIRQCVLRHRVVHCQGYNAEDGSMAELASLIEGAAQQLYTGTQCLRAVAFDCHKT